MVGTAEGITAVQMDIGIAGISEDTISQALAQAKEGRIHILGEMKKILAGPSEISVCPALLRSDSF